MKNHRLECTGHQVEKPVFTIDGLTEGNNWVLNNNGSCFIPSLDLETEIIETSQESYSDTFNQDKLTFKKCAATHSKNPLSESLTLQSDTGANANVMSDAKLLQNVQWVEPVIAILPRKGQPWKYGPLENTLYPGLRSA